ncbi:hypothetical protein BKA82DRAFT_611007 [Pisolithus tinctorius]|uniref:Uncharacterized protein n=1 Tax=Pisolithus tinctorius Marx 270 TaxID=870435 RepID=A0A0C3P808_PISTI|nr:hypothetical protein BKA82DRAFT_611007 [Pisolithus tinctorius]KIO03604.1 hypothetical protein M404DRAFT_611007 [Pisolithus tinctorius Marx 270]
MTDHDTGDCGRTCERISGIWTTASTSRERGKFCVALSSIRSRRRRCDHGVLSSAHACCVAGFTVSKIGVIAMV